MQHNKFCQVCWRMKIKNLIFNLIIYVYLLVYIDKTPLGYMYSNWLWDIMTLSFVYMFVFINKYSSLYLQALLLGLFKNLNLLKIFIIQRCNKILNNNIQVIQNENSFRAIQKYMYSYSFRGIPNHWEFRVSRRNLLIKIKQSMNFINLTCVL